MTLCLHTRRGEGREGLARVIMLMESTFGESSMDQLPTMQNYLAQAEWIALGHFLWKSQNEGWLEAPKRK